MNYIKPKLANYDLAPLTPASIERLSKYVDKAPSWATHIGSDGTGAHYFDHHPHALNGGGARFGVAFLKGLLPDTHRHLDANYSDDDATESLEVIVINRGKPEPTVAQLKTEVVELKAKLWHAEWKLRKITSLITDEIL